MKLTPGMLQNDAHAIAGHERIDTCKTFGKEICLYSGLLMLQRAGMQSTAYLVSQKFWTLARKVLQLIFQSILKLRAELRRHNVPGFGGSKV